MTTAPSTASPARGRATAPRTPDGRPVLGLVVVGLLACVVAVALGGAALAPVAGVSDAGAAVRWSLPLLRVAHDLAASVTIGLLVVAAWLVPGPKGSATQASPTMLRAGRLALWSGVVWVVAGLGGVVLGFADAAGTPLSSPVFWAQLQTFAWSLEALRVGLISSALVAVATVLAAVSLTRKGLSAAAFVAVGALLPLALAGHAGGNADHETAVNTLALHLVGAALWVGGLVAIAVLRPLLGRRLGPVVARFSTLALWCFVAVLVSGVAGAWVRIGDLAGLATPYGALVLVKAAALVVLGGLGWQQRRRVVDRIATDPTSGRLFARLVLVELAVMGVAMGFATALARTAPPVPEAVVPVDTAQSLTGYPAPAAPAGLSWLTTWRFDWLWGLLGIALVAVYVGWVVRLRRRGDAWPVLRTVSWVAGWATVVYAVCGAPGVYGRVSFSWHMIEHMVVAMLAPLLLVLAAPITLALRAVPARRDGSLGPRELLLGMVHSRLLRVLGNPVVAAVLFFTSLAAFYYSPLFGLALETHTGHVLMIAHFLLTGYLFAYVLVGVDPGAPKWSPPLRLVVLLVTISFHAFFGVALMSGSTLLAPDFFETIKVAWIPDPLADQRLGGGIAWGIGEVPTLALAMLVVGSWVRSDRAETTRRDRQADRDGEAELTAYNERLARLRDRP